MSRKNKIILVGSVVSAASLVIAYFAIKKFKKKIDVVEAILVGYLD